MMYETTADDDTDAPTQEALARRVEYLMLEQQRYDPLELLLSTGILAYSDYEAWRLGQRHELQSALRLGLREVLELLRQAAQQALSAGLLAKAAEHRRWGEGVDNAPSLVVGPDAALCRALGCVYEPPPRDRQLDLFYDSGAVAMEQRLSEALLEQRLDAARAAYAELSRRRPDTPKLTDWSRLLAALDDTAPAPAACLTAQQLRLKLDQLAAVAPLAHRLLGPRARDCLALLWNDLERRTADLDFDPQAPRLHRSWVLAQLQRWAEVRTSVEAVLDWRAEPELLARHAAACRRSDDRPSALCDWFRLCWAHPHQADAVLSDPELPDRGLAELWSAYGDLDPPAPPTSALETGDFPAWCVLSDAGLAEPAPAEPTGADPRRATAYRAALALAMRPHDIDRRRALGDAHSTLLAHFLQTRK